MGTLQTTSNKNSIDLTKFIMAICVIAIHTGPLGHCKNYSILTIYDLIVSMAVPFFFLASGYLLAVKFREYDPKEVKIRIVFKQLSKIIRMYFVWNLIYLPLAIYDYYLWDTSVTKAIFYYIKNFVFIGEHYNSWHLWYLLSTIYAFLFVLLLLRMNVKPIGMLIVSALISIISIGIDELTVSSSSSLNILELAKKIIGYTIANGRIFQGLIFMPIGIYMAHKVIAPKICAIVFAVCFAGNYFVTNSVISNYLLIFTSIALFGVIININLKDHLIYPILRTMSTDIYLIHMYIWTFYYLCVYGKKQFGLDSFIFTTALSVIISYLYYMCKKYVGTKN